MAESIIYNTATEILKKLGSMVNQEIKLVLGVKNELHKLENTVSTIKAVLVHGEEQQATNPEIEDWLQKLNDAFYDADDLLDDFSTQVLQHQVMTQDKGLKKVRNFFSSSNQLAFSSKMAHEIKAIREKLDAIAEDRKKFHLTERIIEMRVENTKREETHSFVAAEDVIGRCGDKTKIVELLLDGNVQENVSVVAIVGIGGVGKTTLAQLVYNDEEVTKSFELKKWVCVSDPFDVKFVAQKIIGSEVDKNLQLEEVQNQLREKIDGKKYLLVLDDVWNENRNTWLKLKGLLKGGSRGSKILLTTRSELVATVTAANSSYLLEGLSKEESWSLFKQMTFKQGEESENASRVTIGKEIVEKCRRVPLAIRAIGSLLYSKDTDVEWLVLKNNDLWKIAQEKDDIFPILKLSYDYLPSNLKRCFALCSLYRKDQEIGKKELIQFWIAHGFIQSPHENQQLEDVGDLYFNDLLRRSFFLDVERDEWNDIISCKMHDLIHDLAQSVARLENSTLNSGGENVTERTRHLSFGFSADSPCEILTHSFKAKKLRTFILENEYLKETDFERIVSTYERLRVLKLSNLEIKTVPNYISKLKHLRHLDLSDNDMETLPNSITKLQNLQTLKLNGCSELVELPREIKKLVSLRHLELEECDALIGMPCGLGELTCLLTLPWFVADSYSRLSELQSLNNLRGKLCINIRHREESSSRGYLKKAAAAEGRMQGANYLVAKQYLKTLLLDFDYHEDNLVAMESLRPHPNLKDLKIKEEDDHPDDELWLESLRPHPNLKELLIVGYCGVSFPSWMMVDKIGLSSSLPNLVRIYIRGCGRCKHLPLFGQLPSLQFLSLRRIDSVEYMGNSSSGSGSGNGGEDSLSSSSTAAAIRRSEPTTPTFFPSLKQLELSFLPNLKGWWRSESATTTTETLPDQQQHLTKSLPSFPSLSKLTIEHCPNLASMPILQPCLEQLCLCDVSKKLVEQVLRMTMSPTPTISTTTDTVATSSSSSLLPLSNLKSLTLGNIKDLDDDEDMQFLQGLTNLTDLSIDSIPKLVSLPMGLQHFTTLRTLEILSCDNLMELPEWIGNLTSLERLQFCSCRKLTSLPDGMRQLTALQQLGIQYCTQVIYDRCRRETGKDWPKIAHIPDVYIRHY